MAKVKKEAYNCSEACKKKDKEENQKKYLWVFLNEK
jgi:hypothetical protein